MARVYEEAPIGVSLGLEAVFEYRNLRINDIQASAGGGDTRADVYRLTRISGLEDMDIRDSRDVNPSAHGETAFRSLYGGRTMTFEGRIESGSLDKLRDMQMQLRTAFGALKDDWLYIRNLRQPAFDVQIKCRKIGSMISNEVQSNRFFYRDFQLILRAPYPFYQSVNTKLAQQGFDPTAFYGRTYDRFYPRTYSVPIDSLGNILDSDVNPLTIFNSGNWAASPFVNILGGATNPRLINTTNGEELKIDGTIEDNDFLVIDILNKFIVNSQGVPKNHMLAPDSDWLVIEPGFNTLNVQADSFFGDVPQIHVTFRDTYL